MTARRADWLVALGLFVVVSSVTLAASTQQGVHRDEAVYMDAAEKYARWWSGVFTGKTRQPLSSKAIDPVWSCGTGCNSEHPPLMKTLFGISYRAFPSLSPITAFRLPTVLMFGALAALVYLFFVAALAGPDPLITRAAALAAALLTVAQPRAFFHAQTAAFDLPAAFLWFATAFAYWRALAAPHWIRASLLVGVLYGLFLATKLQSFFLPAALGAHWAFLCARDKKLHRPWPLVAMATIGPLVFWLLWPYLWHHPIANFQKYWAFHANHVHYNFEYLGTNYNRPPFPWHEPIVMLLTTAPVMLLALAAAGIHVLVRSRRARAEADPRATGVFLFLVAFVPVAPFFTGRAPIFGETKHWLASMPVLALCAGVALQAIASALLAEHAVVARRTRIAVLAALLAVVAAPALVETARSHPYGLSHYNALAGGAPGGANLGMNRQFWGYSPRGLFAWMNANLPQGTKIYPHDWSHGAFVYDQKAGLLRKDLQDAGMELPAMRASQTALVVHELHFNKYDYMIWGAYGHLQPTLVLTLDGVPLVSLYQRQPPDPLQ